MSRRWVDEARRRASKRRRRACEARRRACEARPRVCLFRRCACFSRRDACEASRRVSLTGRRPSLGWEVRRPCFPARLLDSQMRGRASETRLLISGDAPAGLQRAHLPRGRQPSEPRRRAARPRWPQRPFTSCTVRGIGMRARFATIALVLTTGLLVPSVARVAVADPSNRNPAAAQALYDEARRLSQGGKYATHARSSKRARRAQVPVARGPREARDARPLRAGGARGGQDSQRTRRARHRRRQSRDGSALYRHGVSRGERPLRVPGPAGGRCPWRAPPS